MRDVQLDAPVLEALEELASERGAVVHARADLREELPSDRVVDGPSIVRVNQRLVPELGALVRVGNTRRTMADDARREGVRRAVRRDELHETPRILHEGIALEESLNEGPHLPFELGVRREPRRSLLRFAARFQHVRLQAFHELAAIAPAVPPERPRTDDALVEQVLERPCVVGKWQRSEIAPAPDRAPPACRAFPKAPRCARGRLLPVCCRVWTWSSCRAASCALALRSGDETRRQKCRIWRDSSPRRSTTRAACSDRTRCLRRISRRPGR